MPTGYTIIIYEGQDVSGGEFIKRCARAFSAYVMVRDEPLDKKVKEEFEPDSYHRKRLIEKTEELKGYYSMTINEAQEKAEEQYEKKVKYNIEQIEKKKNLKNRYEKVLSEVKRWTPPTDEHKELKKYCIEQLKTSIENDCDMSYYIEDVKRLTGKEWLDLMVSSCLQDIEHYSKQQEKENERTKSRNEWIRKLNESLRGF